MLRAGSNRKLRDCCVVPADELVCARVATLDGRLAAAARERGSAVLPR